MVNNNLNNIKQHKIFISGFAFTGSRLLVEILEKLGLNVIKKNTHEITRDFGDRSLRIIFIECFKKNDYKEMFNYLDKYLSEKDNFVVKHGLWMFSQDEIREHYKGSKIIYITRNPIDVAINNNIDKEKNIFYQKTKTDEDYFKWYIEQDIIAKNKADFVVNYEELCFNTKKEINKIKNFLGIEKSIDIDIDIVPSKNIGIGKDYYKKYNLK